MDREYYMDIEEIIADVSSGRLDSTEAVKKLQSLGISPEEAVRDVLPNVIN